MLFGTVGDATGSIRAVCTQTLVVIMSNGYHVQDDVANASEPENVRKNRFPSEYTTHVKRVTGDTNSRQCALLLENGAMSVSR